MEKRKYERIEEKVKFFYKSEYVAQRDWSIGFTNNLSLGGAFARLTKPLPSGTKISLRLPLDFMSRGTTVCNLYAKIVRLANAASHGSGSCGLIFLREGLGNDREVLAKFIREKGIIKSSDRAAAYVKEGAAKRESELDRAMRDAVRDINGKGKKKRGFFARIFGKS